ncbi:unnamed protein product, partial [Meganyctiphanes norvegica]
MADIAMDLPGVGRCLGVIALLFSQYVGVSSENNFREELLIRPLPSGHIYTHAEFTTSWADDGIAQSIEEYQDFVFGYYEKFISLLEAPQIQQSHPHGVKEYWSSRSCPFHPTNMGWNGQLKIRLHKEALNLDQTWQDLVNALSGLICASLNFIDTTNTVSPELSYRPQGLAEEWYSTNSSYMRYAALPRENVCTENLTPWKKLLPCDTKSGLSTLLHPAPLYTAHYHSLSLHLRPACQDECEIPHLELVQALSLVQDTTRNMEGHQDWSIKSLFSAPLLSSCPLSDFTKVYVDVTENEEMRKFSLDPMPDSIEELGSDVGLRRLAIYDVRKALKEDLFNLKAHYHNSHIYGRIPSPPLHVSRFITGYGQEGGSITVKLSNQGSKSLSVVYLEVVPWYLRLYLHTSHAAHNSNSTFQVPNIAATSDVASNWLCVANMRQPKSSNTKLSLEFSRALLKWLEYPPDANHGFYIPAATVSAVLPTARNISTNTLHTNTLKEKLTLSSGPSFVTIHTETLLVSLPTPDFSMPYNVICLACTVVALAFGPIHNITTKSYYLNNIIQKASSLNVYKCYIKPLYGRGNRNDNNNIENDLSERVEHEEETINKDEKENEEIEDED